MNDKPIPGPALWASGVYFVLAFGSWVLPIMAGPDDSLGAIFLVLFAQPWASLWVWVSDSYQLESTWPGMVVMLLGILLNTWIIYRLFSWVSRR